MLSSSNAHYACCFKQMKIFHTMLIQPYYFSGVNNDIIIQLS